jgi:parallel beta-helix repeat protein
MMKSERSVRWSSFSLTVFALISVGVSSSLGAALCVNPSGKGGCKTTINAAVVAANAGDTIQVGGGTYHEDVVIGKSLSLIGANDDNPIIDATGLPNGIDVDGHNNAGLSHVVVNGFTVRNANFQGILVTDASYVSIVNNSVTGNDKSLQPFAKGGPVCPGLPTYFEKGEGFDCGEGIHLSGASYSTVANNVVEKNAGGILLSDDTAPSHDNLIAGNTVRDNPYDCGITIASHHFTFDASDPWGVFHNTIVGNISSSNGLATGEGAGVGLFAGPPGAKTYSNVVVDNILKHNGLPGVTMHSHQPAQNLNNNLIVSNQISDNGPDGDPGTTVPAGIVVFGDDAAHAPPITGTVISQNIIKGEGIDIAIRTSGTVDAHFNDLFDDIGIWNKGTGSVNATQNWWKCSGGPGAKGCGTVFIGTGAGAVQTAPALTETWHD